MQEVAKRTFIMEESHPGNKKPSDTTGLLSAREKNTVPTPTPDGFTITEEGSREEEDERDATPGGLSRAAP